MLHRMSNRDNYRRAQWNSLRQFQFKPMGLDLILYWTTCNYQKVIAELCI